VHRITTLLIPRISFVHCIHTGSRGYYGFGFPVRPPAREDTGALVFFPSLGFFLEFVLLSRRWCKMYGMAWLALVFSVAGITSHATWLFSSKGFLLLITSIR
jgi:hypothetical protein